jgi:hypothetical protein
MQIDQLSHFPSAPFVESGFSELNRFVSSIRRPLQIDVAPQSHFCRLLPLFEYLIEIVALVGATMVGVGFRGTGLSGE